MSSKTNPKMCLIIVLALIIIIGTCENAGADFTFGTPTNLGPMVNSSSVEARPSISADGLSLFFFSNQPGGYGGYWGDLWVTTRETTDNEWGTPVNVGSTINSANNEWAPSISADGLSLYFSSDRPGGYGTDDIWVTTRPTVSDPWGEPVNLGPLVNGWDHDGAQYISPDGLELYFVSGLVGDLWLTKRATTNDDWGEPVKLGPIINSDYTEEFYPAVSADGLLLFFSSGYIRPELARPGGLGASDLWVTRRATKDDDWGTPVNIGPPVNSPAGDACPSISGDGRTLFFSSDRPGGSGAWDLWQAPIIPIVDFNSDGIVDSRDVSIMVDHWHTDNALYDIAPAPWGDGIVDIQDLIVLAEHLLPVFLAHWELDETEGGIAYNSVGDHDGTLNGNPLWQPAGGKLNGALQLDGIDDYISTPFILDPSKRSLSAFAWIKGGAPRQVIISQIGVFGGTWLGTNSSEGKLMTGLSDMYFGALESESVITDGQWHHVGLVYDFVALHRHLYVDGVEVTVDSDYVAGVPSDGGLYIGTGNAMEPGTFWSGLIDDVRIYNRALSPEQIAALAQ